MNEIISQAKHLTKNFGSSTLNTVLERANQATERADKLMTDGIVARQNGDFDFAIDFFTQASAEYFIARDELVRASAVNGSQRTQWLALAGEMFMLSEEATASARDLALNTSPERQYVPTVANGFDATWVRKGGPGSGRYPAGSKGVVTAMAGTEPQKFLISYEGGHFSSEMVDENGKPAVLKVNETTGDLEAVAHNWKNQDYVKANGTANFYVEGEVIPRSSRSNSPEDALDFDGYVSYNLRKQDDLNALAGFAINSIIPDNQAQQFVSSAQLVGDDPATTINPSVGVEVKTFDGQTLHYTVASLVAMATQDPFDRGEFRQACEERYIDEAEREAYNNYDDESYGSFDSWRNR